MKRKLSDYKPFKGFYDLREFNITPYMFRKLWETQEHLVFISERSEYYRKNELIEWNKAAEMCSKYQMYLFKVGRKKEYIKNK